MTPFTKSKFFSGGGQYRYLYLSYHKSATLWTERILRDVCKLRRLRAKSYDSRHPTVPVRKLRRTDFLLLIDYTTGMINLPGFHGHGVHVIRDPRDTLVSMYFSHRFSHQLNHEEIARNRTALESRSVEDGMRWLMDESRFFRRIVDELERWNFDDPRFHETTFERLTVEPEREFAGILSFLDLPLPADDLTAILERNRFERLQQGWAARNPEAVANHYRTGVAGEWREYLLGENREIFRERHGKLLMRLGYAW